MTLALVVIYITTMIPERSAAPLCELGFNGLEADIYGVLLEQSPATGYGIAQALGRPVTNVYKAIESLHNKGAVLVDDGNNRLCRAVPVKELLNQIERRFKYNRKQVEETFADLTDNSVDDRVYQLRTWGQVSEKFRSMMRDCRQIALIDIFPGPLAELKDSVEATASDGKEVAVKVYSPVKLKKATVLEDPMGEEICARWPGQWISLVVDDSELLLAFLSNDKAVVHQAIWSKSEYLSWTYSGALASEMILTSLQQMIDQGAPSERLQKVLEKYARLRPVDTLGFKSIIRRFDRKTNRSGGK